MGVEPGSKRKQVMNLLALAFILSVVATQAYSTSFCFGGDDCCSPNGYTCSLGEGDCDKDADCKDGMFCGKDNCLTDVKGFGKGLGQNTGKQAIKKGLTKFTLTTRMIVVCKKGGGLIGAAEKDGF